MLWRRLRWPLSTVLLAPLACVLVTSMGLIAILNARNAETYAQRAAIKLAEHTSNEVALYLNGFMRQPLQVVENMADAIESGLVNRTNETQLLSYLHQQRQTFSGVPYISYAFADDAFIGVGAGDNVHDADILELRPAGDIRNLFQYSINADGRKGQFQHRDKFGNFLNEDWYAAPIKAKGVKWSEIYSWNDAPDVMAISVGKPIQLGGKTIGVAGTDVLLASLSRRLQGLQLGKRSVIYISEDNGLLVASSDRRLPFDIRDGKGKRRAAREDPNPMIRSSAALLEKRFGSMDDIEKSHSLRAILHQEPYVIRVAPWHDPFGLHWVITLVLPESEFTGFVKQQREQTLLLCLGAVIVASLLSWRVLGKLLQPIAAVGAAAAQLAASSRAPSFRPSGLVEVDRLSEAFTAMAQRLMELVQDLEERNANAEQLVELSTTELLRTNSRLEQEGAMAARIQQDLLVKEEQLNGLANNMEIGALMVASRQVGGDLYDCISLRDELMLFCVGDVAGKGMAAALLMSTCLSLLRSYAEALDSPSAIMRRINQRLTYNNPSCVFTTLVIGVINRKTGEMRYCNAGHNPMLLRRIGSSSEALNVVHGPALGVIDGVVYGEARLFLEPGDLLLAYSDGAPEMFNNRSQRFGVQRLQCSLDTNSSPGNDPTTASTLVQGVLTDLMVFAADEPAHDDITLLAIRRVNQTEPEE